MMKLNISVFYSTETVNDNPTNSKPAPPNLIPEAPAKKPIELFTTDDKLLANIVAAINDVSAPYEVTPTTVKQYVLQSIASAIRERNGGDSGIPRDPGLDSGGTQALHDPSNP